MCQAPGWLLRCAPSLPPGDALRLYFTVHRARLESLTSSPITLLERERAGINIYMRMFFYFLMILREIKPLALDYTF